MTAQARGMVLRILVASLVILGAAVLGNLVVRHVQAARAAQQGARPVP